MQNNCGQSLKYSLYNVKKLMQVLRMLLKADLLLDHEGLQIQKLLKKHSV